jgi:hypothetical protein
MNTHTPMLQVLKDHLELTRDILGIIETESHKLKNGNSGLHETFTLKKSLLLKLNESLDKLRKHRTEWQKLDEAVRANCPEVHQLLRQNQDLTMKMIVLDRENEQQLLRQGMIPAKHLPSAQRQNPAAVAGVYQRQAAR